MALLGQGTVPVGIDYSQMGADAWRLAQSNVGAISGAMGAVGDAIKDRKQKKDTIKASEDVGNALIKLFPETETAIAPILEKLRDEESPLSQRAVLGEQLYTLVNMGVEQTRNKALLDLQSREVKLGERGMDIRENEAKREASLVEKAMADQEQLTEFMARPALERALAETIKAEQRGETPLIGSERLKLAFLKKPDEQMQIVAAAMQGLPKAAPLEFRDIEFTRDGQAAKGTAVFDPRKGQFTLVPVADPTAAATPLTGLPEPLAPYASTFEEAGRKYGIDPKLLAAIAIHETGGGTSPAFRNKNNAMGISNDSGVVAQESVEASIEKMARSLTRPGGYYDGKNTIAEIGAVYAPKGARNDPRDLNKYWPTKVAEYYAALGGDPSGSVRIQPGAATGTPRTSAQIRKEELEIQAMEADAASKKQEAETKARQAQAKAARVLSIIDKYSYKDANGQRVANGRLDDAVGFGAGIGAYVNRAIDSRTQADQQELTRNLIETSLLEAAKDLKPVSEDEMKMLMERRPKITDGPEAWARFMGEAEAIIKEGLPTTSASEIGGTTTTSEDRAARLHQLRKQAGQ